MEAQWSLVLFTVISGAGAWLFATSMIGALAKKSALPTKIETIVAIVLLAVGGIASSRRSTILRPASSSRPPLSACLSCWRSST